MISVKLSSQLATMANGSRRIDVEAETLVSVFEKLDQQAPMLRSQIFDSNGRLRQFVGLFVDSRQVMDIEDVGVHVHKDSEVMVFLSVAGG